MEVGGPQGLSNGGRWRRSQLRAQGPACHSRMAQQGLQTGVTGRRASASSPPLRGRGWSLREVSGIQGGNGSVGMLGAGQSHGAWSLSFSTQQLPLLDHPSCPQRFLTARCTSMTILLCCSMGTSSGGRCPFLSLSFLNHQMGSWPCPLPSPSAGPTCLFAGKMCTGGADRRDSVCTARVMLSTDATSRPGFPGAASLCALVSAAENQGNEVQE